MFPIEKEKGKERRRKKKVCYVNFLREVLKTSPSGIWPERFSALLSFWWLKSELLVVINKGVQGWVVLRYHYNQKVINLIFIRVGLLFFYSEQEYTLTKTPCYFLSLQIWLLFASARGRVDLTFTIQ